jgi:phosphoenolpyruvate synthase/pyruvate phosphate dikinase
MSNSKPLIIRLNNLSDVEPMLIGNKGYNLGRLIQKGFKVPEGWETARFKMGLGFCLGS